jgi:lipoate-protein ligase A
MNRWRLLKLETHSAYMNMAIDEAILLARIQGMAPNTVRFYQWMPSAVSIGKFQNIENEVQMGNCKQNRVDVVRRITGGGTVYHDAEDEITYSVIVGKKDLEATDITTTYAKIYTGLARGLELMGVKAYFNEGDLKACPNLTVKGKKISGSAQSHKKGTVLQHGTLLLRIDLKKMFSLLRVPWAKTCMEIVNVAKDKITSLEKELGRVVSIEETERALVEGFQETLNSNFDVGSLTAFERDLASKLHKQKYSTTEWNFYAKSS